MTSHALRLAFAAIILAGTIHAQVPRLINYQGRVAVGSVNFDGAGKFKFAFVDSAGATSFWSNDGSSVAGSEPAQFVTLPVSKGLYSVLLGDSSIASMSILPASVFTKPDIRLRVWFNDGVLGWQRFSPDQRLAPEPYLADGTVTAASIADGAISAAKIAPGAIDGSRVAPASLSFGHLAVPAAPGAGQVLGFNGVGLNWMTPGAVGSDGIWTRNGASTIFFNGSVGVGTSTPASRFTILTPAPPPGVPGILRTGFEHTDGTVRLATYAEPTQGGWLGTLTDHPLNLFVKNGQPSLTITLDGAVSMSGGGAGYVVVGTPNAETGMSMVRGNGRADLRFDGSTLKFVAGPMGGPPGSSAGIAVTTGGNVGIGTTNPGARLDVIGTTRTSVLTITGGADIAEPFLMKEEGLEKGSVVVIDEESPGRLKCSILPYDTRVAGIVSGANGINAGIALHQEGAIEGGQNVALSGRVYVRADAKFGRIAPGDLLTTSTTPGHAMRVGDSKRAQGAILGKAMSALDEGTGMVLVLVTLQ